jgi:cytochrome c5
MSNETNASSNVSLVQKIIIGLGGIIAPIFVLYTITKSPDAPKSAVEVPAERSEVLENIKPLAVVEVATDSGPAVVKTGEEIVNQACAACHASGMMESPKLGDVAAWSVRIAQGYETLTKHAIEGIRMMPARGGNPDLTDNDIAKAVAYMANGAGANFAAPESAEPEASADEAEATEAPAAE